METWRAVDAQNESMDQGSTKDLHRFDEEQDLDPNPH
jgi:hypothetical protein